MLHSPPREHQWQSWLFVLLWSILIFISIPLARTIQNYVRNHWGEATFTYFVLITVVIAGALAVIHLLRRSTLTPISWKNYIYLAITATVFIGYTFRLSDNPEEAIHFVEYGILSLLLYRALVHRIRDSSIFLIATILGSIIGIIDETIQWITPERYWAYKDVWINFLAVALVQLGIAKGLSPSIVRPKLKRESLRYTIKFTILAVILLGLTFLNTPERIAWYTSDLPQLAFLKDNPSTMIEYGYLYQDPEIGIFRSRLSPQALRDQDRERGLEAASTLDEYGRKRSYKAFLRKYTAYNDPFLHEVRVHLFRRDRYLKKAEENSDDRTKYTEYLTVAHRENLIMEKYFPHTLKNSSFVLPLQTIALMNAYNITTYPYESKVSRRLFTGITERQVLTLLLIVLVALVGIHHYLGRVKEPRVH